VKSLKGEGGGEEKQDGRKKCENDLGGLGEAYLAGTKKKKREEGGEIERDKKRMRI